ncbi:erythromycin esterase family protein [Streptomyces nigrescens]
MRYRDAVMADNVAWWQQRTGDKTVLSAHDAHVALRTYDPKHYPKVQGSFLRDKLGTRYVSISMTFDRGSFNATGADGRVRAHTVGPAKPSSNEYALDRVRHRDYVLDLRTVPPAARAWLATARSTRSIGTEYPGPGVESQIALARSHDIVVRPRQVMRFAPCACAMERGAAAEPAGGVCAWTGVGPHVWRWRRERRRCWSCWCSPGSGASCWWAWGWPGWPSRLPGCGGCSRARV